MLKAHLSRERCDGKTPVGDEKVKTDVKTPHLYVQPGSSIRYVGISTPELGWIKKGYFGRTEEHKKQKKEILKNEPTYPR